MLLSVQRVPSREGDDQVRAQSPGQQVYGSCWWGGCFPAHQRAALPLAGGASHALPSPEADIIAGSPPWGPRAVGR